MQRTDFNFNLPKNLIASYPSEQRTSCRMLSLDGASGSLEDLHFYDLKRFLQPGDLLVFNDTKVIAARLYGHKDSGGKVEILIERILTDTTALAHMKASKACKAGTRIELEGGYSLEVQGREGALFILKSLEQPILNLLDAVGHIPLPPYIDRPDEQLDKERYQTVYSKHLGAVAAPTAGLHFDDKLLQQLQDYGVQFAYVTLHVGAGTFQPVRVDDITQHQMHAEFVQLDEQVATAVIQAHQNGHRVIAVGTTAVRSLESAAAFAKSTGSNNEIVPFAQDTSIFIYPGYHFKIVDALITNFHLPESTLIMLVSAFAGYSHTMQAYRHAVAQEYKFFSYGDCMFISKNPQAYLDLPQTQE